LYPFPPHELTLQIVVSYNKLTIFWSLGSAPIPHDGMIAAKYPPKSGRNPVTEVNAMVRSMTGYGRKEEEKGALRVTVEIRSVNHRFSDILVRLPKAWTMLEDSVRKQVAPFIRRGRADVTIVLDKEAAEANSDVEIDWHLASRFVQIAREMSERFALETPLTPKDLLLLPGVVHTKEGKEEAREDTGDWILMAVKGAAEDLLAMKIAEGAQLQIDLSKRLMQIREWVSQLQELVPQASEEYRKRLQQRMADLLSQVSVELDPQRIVQEVTFFAERSDISEEVTRLQSHCLQFSEQLGRDDAIGRGLDFLLQEMNREANTIASKANHLHIQHLAVEIKTELEKMREQVQNIE